MQMPLEKQTNKKKKQVFAMEQMTSGQIKIHQLSYNRTRMQLELAPVQIRNAPA